MLLVNGYGFGNLIKNVIFLIFDIIKSLWIKKKWMMVI